MYEETFGTDWEEVDRDEALRRAFALGVAEALSAAPPEGELERLSDQVRGRYGQSLVELAYDEGRTKGDRPAPDRDRQEVWEDLVESPDDGSSAGRFAREARPDRPTDLPGSVSPPTFFEREGSDDLGKFDLPEFLR